MMFLDCPAYLDNEGSVRCGFPAEVRYRFNMRSTGGPLESAMIRCPAGHHFSGPIESLTWDSNDKHDPGAAAIGFPRWACYLDRHRPTRAPLPSAPPTVREVTGWLTRHPDSLTAAEQPKLNALLERCPELRAADAQVRAFARMLTQLTGQDLPQWISDAQAAGLPGLSSFAKGLKQDLDAVTQGLTTRWNSGPVEGRVNHRKDDQKTDVRKGRTAAAPQARPAHRPAPANGRNRIHHEIGARSENWPRLFVSFDRAWRPGSMIDAGGK
jgi:hypothetical protein